MQGGTHEEMPCPAILVVDGAAGLLAEAGVGFGMVKVKVDASKVCELVFSEAQFPGDVAPAMGRALSCSWMKGMASWLSS